MSVTDLCYDDVDMNDDIITVDRYHQRTKHSLQQYARGPDGLDWDTQPDPFRTYAGSKRYSLPLCARDLKTPYTDLYHPGRVSVAPVTLENIATLYELSMGLSSWKIYGATRWALRNNPSSGNLHPSESYLIYPGSEDLPPGVYHYHVYAHSLEQRCEPGNTAAFIAAFPVDGFLVGLSSIHWREAWKYGERAYRYCQHDVGHAIACFRYAAAALGWRVRLLDSWSDAQIAGLLGLDRANDYEDAERESPDTVLQVSCYPPGTDLPESTAIDPDSLIDLLTQSQWNGTANKLSPDNRINWEIIERIESHCRKPVSEPGMAWPDTNPVLSECNTQLDASSVIRKRRSAQAFDATSVLPLPTLYRMLDCLLPRANVPPFDTLPWQARIHLVLFVHRVDGLRPGLYVLPRSEQGEQLLRDSLREQFDWARPPVCPEWLPLYHLVSANSRNAARTLSCHQDIAADSAFCISMIAEFEKTIEETPWRYRHLFWEAGMIGQSLYLEAEAANISGTGIGCFFDDAVHETLGISNTRLQSLYNFTVGTAVQDARLVSLPPYSHLEDLQKD
ncbi:MAG: SagB/ThcOx family dehydrogenase [Gammaproteobacteria bacterium]